MERVKITGLLDGEEFPKELPIWFKDFVESQKWNWIPDSKGGEPNCKKELPQTPWQRGVVSLYLL